MFSLTCTYHLHDILVTALFPGLENQTEAKNNVETATIQDEILSERCVASLTAQEYETDGLNTVPTCVIKLLFNFRKVTALFSQVSLLLSCPGSSRKHLSLSAPKAWDIKKRKKEKKKVVVPVKTP